MAQMSRIWITPYKANNAHDQYRVNAADSGVDDDD